VKRFFLSATILFAALATTEAKTIRYDLTITQERINVSGKKEVDFALLVNKTIPAPVLEFTEGDEAEITVTNGLSDDEVSIHWHGILLPPEMDGVPYVNTPPIFPGKTYTFRFKIRQSGTYWYHSHTNVQEQKGVYGAFIIHPKQEKVAADKDVVVVLSDWSDEDATKILKNLRKDGDFYQYKKNSIRSWAGAIRAGQLSTYLGNELTRMGGMDPSDVGYDAFLINGKRDSQLLEAHPGEKIRLRIINAAASTYFYVALGAAPMRVISADGVDIEPSLAKEFLVGMAETYDILFEVPEHKNFELRATAQDGTGFASGWIGMGPKVPAPDRPEPDVSEHAAHSHAGLWMVPSPKRSRSTPFVR
jgi:FtsP/CotA-like multicopper oxidase with cupredoxin domain